MRMVGSTRRTTSARPIPPRSLSRSQAAASAAGRANGTWKSASHGVGQEAMAVDAPETPPGLGRAGAEAGAEAEPGPAAIAGAEAIAGDGARQLVGDADPGCAGTEDHHTLVCECLPGHRSAPRSAARLTAPVPCTSSLKVRILVAVAVEDASARWRSRSLPSGSGLWEQLWRRTRRVDEVVVDILVDSAMRRAEIERIVEQALAIRPDVEDYGKARSGRPAGGGVHRELADRDLNPPMPQSPIPRIASPSVATSRSTSSGPCRTRGARLDSSGWSTDR